MVRSYGCVSQLLYGYAGWYPRSVATSKTSWEKLHCEAKSRKHLSQRCMLPCFLAGCGLILISNTIDWCDVGLLPHDDYFVEASSCDRGYNAIVSVKTNQPIILSMLACFVTTIERRNKRQSESPGLLYQPREKAPFTPIQK